LKIVAILPVRQAFVHDHPEDDNLAVTEPARKTKRRG
jgi:hypothetical protein